MGLDTSHDCWHGPYSAFHRWRCALARELGIRVLNEMEGFEGLGIGVKQGKPWPSPRHPVHVLLWHSDCGGSIKSRKLLLGISDTLLRVVEMGQGRCCPEDYPSCRKYGKAPEWGGAWGHDHADALKFGPHRADYDGFYAACRRFALGCKKAAIKGEAVVFA